MYVSVEADGAEAEYGGRRAHDVGRQPEVAEDRTKDPPTEDVVDHGERHHGNGHQHVGDRQGDEEVVARLAKMAIGRYGNDDEQIPGESEDYEEREEKSKDDTSGQMGWTPSLPARRRRRYGGRGVVPPIFMEHAVVCSRRRVVAIGNADARKGQGVVFDGFCLHIETFSLSQCPPRMSRLLQGAACCIVNASAWNTNLLRFTYEPPLGSRWPSRLPG